MKKGQRQQGQEGQEHKQEHKQEQGQEQGQEGKSWEKLGKERDKRWNNVRR